VARPTDVTARRSRRARGRRSGGQSSRSAILTAARARFARHGYEATTIRAIAADVGVDPSLIMQFYGNKDGLFAAVLDQLADVSKAILASLTGPQRDLGARLTRTYLELWERPDTGDTLRSLVRAALGSPSATATFQTYLTGRLTASDLPVPKRLGYVLAVSHLFGTAVGRYIVHAPALTKLPLDELVRLISPAVDTYLKMNE